MSLLKCPKCGELFSNSYKTCPFCAEDEEYYNKYVDDKIDTEFVKVLTFAPELDKTGKFLEELLKRNIIPSVGHTDCKYDIACEVFKKGAKQVTHIFNAIRPIHHREPSVITAALLNDSVSVEIIADLEHVHKAVIEMILKL